MRAAALLFLATGLLAPWGAAAQYDDDPDPGPEPGESCQAGDVVISTVDNPPRFNPSSVTVSTSQTVCIRNSSSMDHNFHVPGVIRCAGACSNPYNAGDSLSNPRGNWVTRLSFSEPGTLGYRCDFHYLDGMTGQITVQGPAGGQPGSLSFTGPSFSVGEAGGSATITVRRTGGSQGAVSVHYATAAGTASPGSDFTPAAGTLSWAGGDAANKAFAIPILNDTADEPNETVQITLDSPTGGAALGSPSAAVLTINDNDGGAPPPGTAPAAPSNLKAEPLSTDEIRLTWKDNSSNESQFTIERKKLGGSFSQIGTAPGNATQFLDDGLDPATYYLYRVRAANAAGNSAFTPEAAATTSTTPSTCQAAGDTLCFLDRFQLELGWRFASGQSGAGQAVSLAVRSGAFYFQNAENLEMLVKMVNACGINNRYWVFFAATTNVEYTLTVTDTQTGRINTYFNPQGRPAPPVQDTDAFATCP